MARKGNPISVRLDLNRSSDSSRFRSNVWNIEITVMSAIQVYLLFLKQRMLQQFPIPNISVRFYMITHLILYIVFFKFLGLIFNSLLMNELYSAVAPFLPASGGGIEGFNPPPAPSDNSVFVCTEEPAQEVGESSQRAPRKKVYQAELDDSREMRLAEKHSLACDKRIQEIVNHAKALYTSGGLDIQIKEEDDIERGVQSFFADMYEFDDHKKRMTHINRAFMSIGNKRSPIWNKIKALIEN